MNDSKIMFERYAFELSSLEGVRVIETQDEDGLLWTFTSSRYDALKVKLRWWQRGADFVLLDIDGVDTGYWHTAEEETLDYHVKLAKAALLGDVMYNRSPIFRFKEVCFKVDNEWECTLTDKFVGPYHYIKTRKRLKMGISDLKDEDLKATLNKLKSNMPDSIIEAHTRCSGHPEDIHGSKMCGCFYCLKTFSPEKIKEWIDNGQTPMCPFCGIDSVLGDKSGYPITQEFLSEMNKHWFESDGISIG